MSYIERRAKSKSNDRLNTIRMECIDGVPRYVLVDGDDKRISDMLPRTGLYESVVVSEDRYNDYKDNYPVDAELAIQVECIDAATTTGKHPYKRLSEVEKMYYKTEIRLTTKEFNYYINEITVNLFEIVGLESNLKGSITLDDGDYDIVSGKLYLTKTLEELIYKENPALEEEISNSNSMWFYKLNPSASVDKTELMEKFRKQYSQKIIFSWTFSNLPNLMLVCVWTRVMKELQELEASMMSKNFDSVDVTVLVKGKMFPSWLDTYLEDKIKQIKDNST